MANFFQDNDDLQFYVERGIDWEPIVELTEYMYKAEDGFENSQEAREFYGQIMEMVGQFVADEIDPHVLEIDEAGVSLKDGEVVFPSRLEGIFEALADLDLHGMCMPRELGGLNCPLMVYMINTELFARADVAVSAHHSFFGGIGMAMLLYSLREGSSEFSMDPPQITSTRFDKEMADIRQGIEWGSMDITEPDAGSDMGALRTRGYQDEAGNWFVDGTKIFITSGHGKYHFVIARTEEAKDPDDAMGGLKGLSMFLVPAYEDDENGKRVRYATIDRLEEKLGHHASATCTLNFEKAPAKLVGERGEGFKYMLTLMNNARIAVGFESLGICEAAYRKASSYAAQRGSMGKTIDRHEMIADYLDEMDTDIKAIRALCMHATYHEELYHKTEMLIRTGMLTEEEDVKAMKKRQERHRRASRRCTPLLKYMASEKSVQMSQRCIQIMGGSGYISEYGAGKLLRDAMVMPIYEGTSQIQSLMAMKDTLGSVMKNPQRFVKKMAQARWRSVSARDPLERRLARIQSLSMGAQQHLIVKTAAGKIRTIDERNLDAIKRHFKDWDIKRDFSYALLHAERLTRLMIDELVCELLMEQAQKFPERRPILEAYIERAEPRCRFYHSEITTSGERLLDKLDRINGGDSQEAV